MVQFIQLISVVVDAGAHSLFLAHKMGYGKHMGSLSMAEFILYHKWNLLKW